MREQEQRMRDLIDPPALRAMREQEQRMRDLVDPPALRAMREQEQRMRDLIDPPALRAMREQEQRMRDLINPMALRAVRECEEYRRIHETVLDRIAAIRPSLGTAERTSSTLTLPLATRDYSGIAAAFDAYISAVKLGATSVFTAVPNREFFVSADLLSRLTGRGLSREDVDADPQRVRGQIDLYVYETLDEALTDFAPKLLSPLEGARQISFSKNPDKIRYACVSLRTVSLGVLELLAPNDRVKKWSSRPRDFYNGHPRTLTRLRFIAQRIGSPELAKFMEADSQAICQLLDVLHTGTHEVGVTMNLQQMRYLFRRVESFLCALVEATLKS
jgi:hypothetical protein